VNEVKAYIHIAERTINSSKTLANEGIQEISAFCSYHAFESIGGAVCSHLGLNYPRNHHGKLNQFIVASTKLDHRLTHNVSIIAITLNSLGRNDLLYPNSLPDGSFEIPEQQLTVSNAHDLVRRIRGIRRVIDKYVR
jgi:HEPN domain-containing protein